jgi:ethanolamine kinase
MPAAAPKTNGHQDDCVDSPLALRHIELSFDNAEGEKCARELVEAYSPEWKNEEGPIEFVRFTDGITNTLMKATKRRPGKTDYEIEKDAILIRAYGKGTDILIDRERELRAHNLLANLGLAPPLLARFDNGLLYSFIAGDVCTPEDLRKPEVYRQVAKRLGQWHGALPISAITSTPILDSNNDKSTKHLATKNGNHTRPTPNTWIVMQQWLEVIPTRTEKEKERKKLLEAEVAEVSAKLGDMPGIDGRDYVFAHCDLLSGNVIMPTADPAARQNGKSAERPVQFIDYEYATPGHAAFDIANHFAEWCGFDCDHSQVPTRSQRREFLKHYVGSYRYHAISDDDTMTVEIDFQKDIDQLYDQVEQFRGIPGLYWGIWAIIQHEISQIDFDYATYAEHRLHEYWAFKEEADGSRKREGREMYVRERRWHSE